MTHASLSAPDRQDAHILVVDDDDRIRALLNRYLSAQGFRISTAADAKDARRYLQTLTFDLIILDVMMPGETGMELTSSLREFDAVPIILLTAMGDAEHRIEGLRRGADDYLAKPFEPEELVLRIESVLRRQGTSEPAKALTFGPWTFDSVKGILERGEERVRLTTAELDLLRVLARRPGEPVTREALAKNINANSERAVDVQVTRLRRKIESGDGDPQYILTVRGRGYRLLAEPA